MLTIGLMQVLPPPVNWKNVEVSESGHEWADTIKHIKWMLEENGPEECVWQSLPDRAERFWLDIDCTIEMHLVETEEALPRSLDALRACRMDDDIVAIDLEWTPDAVSGQNNPVALMSLASSSCVVLIRLCRMRGMPSQLRDFLSDKKTVLVGLGWHNDERKMVHSFGVGRDMSVQAIRIRFIASSPRYQKRGLAALAEQVLQVTLSKSKSVTRSDWAAPALTWRQVLYAAQDALVCGGIFREPVLQDGGGGPDPYHYDDYG